MLAVIDYGGGNLGSLLAALRKHGAPFIVTADPDELSSATAAIFPGDGAFSATMDALRSRRLDRALVEIISSGKPFLGICVGMQILYESSDEFAESRGLGLFAGNISRFIGAPRVPHMGWNSLEPIAQHPLVEGLQAGDYAYFLHSYRALVGEETVIATTHGERFSAIVARANLMGTQFHPEKSRQTGALVLKNFLRLAKERAS